MNDARVWATTISMLLIVAAVAVAGGRVQRTTRVGVSDAYQVDGSAVTYRSDSELSGDSIAAIGTALADGSVDNLGTGIGVIDSTFCGGYRRVTVSGKLTIASATCKVFALRFNWDGTTLTHRSTSVGTLTAGALLTDKESYVTEQGLAFDTRGAELMKFLVAAPSSGTVRLTAEVH